MIYDTVDNISSYTGLSPLIDRALQIISSGDVFKYEPGIHRIEGDDLRVQVSDYSTKNPSEIKYEAHVKYIDIQLLGFGNELCGYRPLKGLIPAGEFNTESDIGFFEEDDLHQIMLPLSNTRFAILFPQDAHKPCCHPDTGAEDVRKIVIKVAVV